MISRRVCISEVATPQPHLPCGGGSRAFAPVELAETHTLGSPQFGLLAVALAAIALSTNTLFAADPAQLPVGEARVFSLAFSPDGKQMAVGTGGQSPTAKLFDIASKKELLDFRCEKRGAAFSIAFSPDGKQLAIGDYDMAVTIRDLKDGHEIASLPGDPDRKKYRQAKHVAFTTDGKSLVVGYNTGEIAIWNIADRTVINRFDHQEHEITALAVSRDGKWIATGTSFGLRVWDPSTGKPQMSVDQKRTGQFEAHAIAFLPDQKTIVTADSPGFVRSFLIADGSESGSFKMPSVGKETTVYGVGTSKDGKTLIAPGLMSGVDPKQPRYLTAGILLLDASSLKPTAFLESISPRVQAVSLDGRTAALATGDSGDPVYLYDLSTAKPLKP